MNFVITKNKWVLIVQQLNLLPANKNLIKSLTAHSLACFLSAM